MTEINQEQQQAFKQVKAFVAKADFWGIPADLFYAIVGGSVVIGATVRSPLLIVTFLLFFGIPAYRIHKEDPHALKIWIKAAKNRTNRWCAGRSTKRTLTILQKEEV